MKNVLILIIGSLICNSAGAQTIQQLYYDGEAAEQTAARVAAREAARIAVLKLYSELDIYLVKKAVDTNITPGLALTQVALKEIDLQTLKNDPTPETSYYRVEIQGQEHYCQGKWTDAESFFDSYVIRQVTCKKTRQVTYKAEINVLAADRFKTIQNQIETTERERIFLAAFRNNLSQVEAPKERF